MKICILSDSHGNKNKVDELLNHDDFDYFFFLGDGLRDFDDYDDIKIKKVSGNCDLLNNEALTQFITLLDHKIMLTHGHDYRAKYTLSLMLDEAKNNNCDIVCFGHTHKQKNEIINGILFLNPGALKNNNYMILSLNKNQNPIVECF